MPNPATVMLKEVGSVALSQTVIGNIQGAPTQPSHVVLLVFGHTTPAMAGHVAAAAIHAVPATTLASGLVGPFSSTAVAAGASEV